MEQNNGGPAFPHPGTYGVTADGMTLRDYFAGHALAWAAQTAMEFSREASPSPAAARLAYEMADAMLAERDK